MESKLKYWLRHGLAKIACPIFRFDKALVALLLIAGGVSCAHYDKHFVTDLTPFLDYSEKPSVYRLRAGDIIQLEVFQEPVMTARQRVLVDGSINVGLVGRLNVMGLTLEEASKKVAAALNEKQLVNPQVTLTVLAYAPSRFSVLGQVKSVGSYSMPPEEILYLPAAVAMGGGNTILGNPKRIVVIRKNGDEVTNIRVNLFDEKAQFFRIKPGDSIYVPETVF